MHSKHHLHTFLIAEILPRFVSKLTSYTAHKRLFSDRDPLFCWLYALIKLQTRSPRSGPTTCKACPAITLSVAFQFFLGFSIELICFLHFSTLRSDQSIS